MKNDLTKVVTYFQRGGSPVIEFSDSLLGEAEAFQDVCLAADTNGLVEWIDLTEEREVVAD